METKVIAFHAQPTKKHANGKAGTAITEIRTDGDATDDTAGDADVVAARGVADDDHFALQVRDALPDLERREIHPEGRIVDRQNRQVALVAHCEHLRK